MCEENMLIEGRKGSRNDGEGAKRKTSGGLAVKELLTGRS